MAWVWDNARTRKLASRSAPVHRDAGLRRFLDTVDVLYYGAAAVLAASIIALVGG